MSPRKFRNRRGLATIWIVLGLAAMAALVVVVVRRNLQPVHKEAPPPPPMVATTPTPVPTPEPPPETPTPPPAPTPERFQLAELAIRPDLWPREVTLKERVAFPAVVAERVVGTVDVESGTVVTLAKVTADNVAVTFHGSTKLLPAEATDVEQRAIVLRREAALRPSPTPTPAPVETPLARERGPPSPKPTPISIVTWNLEWFPGRQPDPNPTAAKEHMREAKQAVAKIDPDVLLLQEVRDLDAIEELVADLQGYKVHIVSRYMREGKLSNQQQAIASRLPADTAFAEEWKQGGSVFLPRGFAFSALKAGPNHYVLTYSVHLKSNRGESSQNIKAREESARQLAAHVAKMLKTYERRGTTAVVIGGDFNLLEHDEFKNEATVPILRNSGLEWCWEGVPLKQRITWPPRGNFEGASFDHFFLAGAAGKKVEILPNRGASDHLPLRLTLELK